MASTLRIRVFMHVPFEGPGIIEKWIEREGHELQFTRFHEGDELPEEGTIDLLVIMGGPMNVYDFHIHPWMQDEIDWVSAFIRTGKPVLGICLGAQIIASALGVEVNPGKEKEIGWFNLKFLPALGEFRIWKDLPPPRKVFHWHGDTFPIPEGAIRIAESQAYPNQGFIFNQKVIALQFHLEVIPGSVRSLVENCRDELVPGTYVQSEERILAESSYFDANQELMFQILDYLCLQAS
jgi:GMP synthase-like glutamine amidotransferase